MPIDSRFIRMGFGFDLQAIERARFAAAGHGINKDGCIVTTDESRGEIEAADAEIHDANFVRQRPQREGLHDLDSERIVAEEDVADPRDENPRRHGCSSAASGTTSCGAKKNWWP